MTLKERFERLQWTYCIAQTEFNLARVRRDLYAMAVWQQDCQEIFAMAQEMVEELKAAVSRGERGPGDVSRGERGP